jgi:hypothetical protein
MAERIDHGAHQIAWTGTRARTGDPAPGFGTWEVVEHEDCPGHGALKEVGRGDPLPGCPVCGADVGWQLTHLAPNVAADHRGVGHLP